MGVFFSETRCTSRIRRIYYVRYWQLHYEITTQTEFLASSVVEDDLVGRVESDASHHVADLGAVDHAVSTVPEVEQIEHVAHVYTATRTNANKVT